MAEHILQTRIVQKHDTEAKWNASSFVPKKGEIIIYDTDSNYNYERVKIGNGSSTVKNLPFISAETADELKVARTVTFSGDVSGSFQFDGSADVSSTLTVKDDSHNHVISNIDNLQTTLDAKVAKSGDTMTGDLKFSAHNVDRYIWFNHADTVSRWRMGYKGSNSGNANYFIIESDKNVENGDFGRALQIGANTLDSTFGGNITAPKFIGPLEGNATSATKLATARTIDGVSFDGSAAITHYGTCSTAAATAAKTVALTSFNLVTGARIAVKFTVTNTAINPTLNVNSTGAKAIMYRGSAISAGYLAADRVYEFVYDGTNWIFIGDINTNTTYTANTGITLSGTTFKHTNSVTAGTASEGGSTRTLSYGGTFKVPSITYDAQGHVTAQGSVTLTLPTAYSLPAAGTSLGGVKSGGDVSISNGTITVNNDSHNHSNSTITSLDASKLTGTIPTALLPSYVDDVLEYSAKSNFPTTGETGKIYVDTATNKTYRWGGSAYAEISPSLALGTTSSTAYRGDYGAAAYAHAVTNKGIAKASGLYKITTNSEGHVTAATAVTKSDITGLGIPAQDTTYGAAGESLGLVKTGGDVTISSGGVITVVNDSHKHSASTISSVYEANLSWGGKNFSGAYGPIDAAMISVLGADRFAFGKPAGVTVEYSRDGGTTWLDYEATDQQKNNLFSSGGINSNLVIGKNSIAGDSTIEFKNYLLRVTIDTDVFQVYSTLNKFAIYISTSGATDCYCSIDASIESTPTTYVNFANEIPILGWSGWNIINTNPLVTYGNSTSTHYGKVRFTFGCKGGTAKSYPGLTIQNIMAFGGVGWTVPSKMGKTGHLYSWDGSQNATFPAKITATTFQGNGSALSSLNASNISSGTLNAERLPASGVAANSYGPSANAAPGSSGNFSVPYITVDSYGRVTAASTKTITMPSATSVSLNGSSTTSATFYAPTSAGTAGQVLKSQGSGKAPTWAAEKTYSAGTGLVLSGSSFSISEEIIFDCGTATE